MNKGLPWIILGVVVVAGIIAYIVISNRSTSSSGSSTHTTTLPSTNTSETPSQWVTDLGALATIYQHLYEAGVITK